MSPPETSTLDPEAGLAVDSGLEGAAGGEVVALPPPPPAAALLGGSALVGVGANGVTTAPLGEVEGVSGEVPLVGAVVGAVAADDGGDDDLPTAADLRVAAEPGDAVATGVGAAVVGVAAADVVGVGAAVVGVGATDVVDVGAGGGGEVDVVVGLVVVDVGVGVDPPVVGTLAPDDDGGVAGAGTGGAVGLKSNSWPELSTAAHDSAAGHDTALRWPSRSSSVGADHPDPWKVT